MVENIFSALQSGRPAGDHDALVKAGAGFGHGSGRQIHVDIVGDKEIKVAVAIVVDKSAAGVPAFPVARDAGLCADIGERAVAIVVIENVLAEIGDEQVVPAVVVVVADAASLTPAGMRESSLLR